MTWSDEYLYDPEDEEESIESDFSIVELADEDEGRDDDDLAIAFGLFLAGEEDNDWEPDSWDDDSCESFAEWDE